MNTEDIRKIFKGRRIGAIGKHKFFSVLVPFVEVDGKLNLLYEVRSQSVDQPGEICFPGGHMLPYELPQDAALRETSEELGISPYRIETVGRGDVLYGSANYTLYTYIGIIRKSDFGSLKPNDEVKEVFLAPVDELLAEEPEIHNEKMVAKVDESFPYDTLGIGQDYNWHTPEVEIPIYKVGDYVIWGITGRITKSVLEIIRSRG
ncbi:MAG: CoA pyrophosphatase [Eubacteriales bacterium]|nr:CoA pyrophosphatase [Eubacteriales bacterium]